MLKVDKVTKYYGNFKAVDNLSFTVKPGEIFGLLGVNGAGKTTTFRMIMGLLDTSAGEISLDGKKIDYDVTDSIGFLTEERSLLKIDDSKSNRGVTGQNEAHFNIKRAKGQ